MILHPVVHDIMILGESMLKELVSDWKRLVRLVSNAFLYTNNASLNT